MLAEVVLPQPAQLWVPINFDADPEMKMRNARFLRGIGRLKEGVTLDQAQVDTDLIAAQLEQQYPDSNTGWSLRLIPLREILVGGSRTMLFIVFGAVGFVLLIACANVANLLLARAIYRQKEIAVRTALGASRLRIIRQLVTESRLLSLVSGAAGLALSVWLAQLLIAVSPANSPRFEEIRIDASVFVFTFAVTLLTALIFGLAPALQASRPDLNETLKESGRQGSQSVGRNRLGSLLMVSEIALSFILLAGAGLLIRSFIRLRDVDPGFNADNVITMRLSAAKYPDGEPRVQFYRQAIERIRTLPGVESAGVVVSLPLSGG